MKQIADTTVNACAGGTAQFQRLCQLGGSDNNFGSFIGTVINVVFIAAAVVALGYLVWGGLKWILSEGDSKSVEAARGHIIAAVVGLIIIFLSYFIMNILLRFFLGTTLLNLQLPNLQSIPG